MAAERDSQAELEREIAALIRERLPQASGCDIAIDIIENNGGGPGETRIKFTPSAPAGGGDGDGAEESAEPPDKPDPTKRQPWHPPGEPSPIIYPPEDVDEETMRRAFDFEPETMRGKPLSQTVIEDRQAGWQYGVSGGLTKWTGAFRVESSKIHGRS